MSSLSICAILFTVFDFSTYVVNKHLIKYAYATIPCNLSLMACFADIRVSRGSAATYARGGGIFNIHLTTNLLMNLPVKTFLKSVNI